MADRRNGLAVVVDGQTQEEAWDEMSVRVLKECVRGRLRVHTMWGKDVEVLGGPQDFFNTLCEGIKAAETRILISMLDIASGDEEMELLSLMKDACLAKPRLQVLVLLDSCRMHGPGGFRGSRHRLRHLAATMPQIQVLMYRHPYSRHPWPMRFLPHAARQIQGVLHMKAVVLDESVVITGANLRGEYFHARQDRYLRLHSRGVSDTYASLLTLLGRYSARPLARPPLSPKRPRWVHLWASCFGTRRPSKEEKELRQRLLALLHDEKGEEEGESKDAGSGGEEEGDTWVLVDLQLPSLGIRENERLSSRLLSCLPTSAHVRLSTGYCNPAEHVITGLRRFAAQGQVEVLVPCVWSSGVSVAGGDHGQKYVIPHSPFSRHLLSGCDEFYERWLAAVYEGVETLLWERLTSQPETHDAPPSKQHRWRPNVRVLEYDREGCSYHAKGLWIDWPHTDLGGPLSNPSTPTADAREGGGRGRKVVEDEEEGEEKRRQEGSDEEGLVCVSMAGSSNLDQRGFERDVESEVLVLTCSRSLQSRFGEEWARLTSHASTIGEEQWRERRHGPLGGGCKRCCMQGVLGCVGTYL